jgi:signal transduction histidine kinase
LARVLVIDDDASVHVEFRTLLQPGPMDSAEPSAPASAEPGAVLQLPRLSLDFVRGGQDGVELIRHAQEEQQPFAVAFVSLELAEGWDGLETVERIWGLHSELQIVLCTAHSESNWTEIMRRLGQTNRLLILKRPFDALQVHPLTHSLIARAQAERQLLRTHEDLMHSSRLTGMAEVATSVLHNVGNVLNSVNVSTCLLADRLERSRLGSVSKAAGLLQAHRDELGSFFEANPKGRIFPEYLVRLAESLEEERAALVDEVKSLAENVRHIKEIVARQQTYAKRGGLIEPVELTDLVNDALRMNSERFIRAGVEVIRLFQDAPLVAVDKHVTMQILVNLLSNACYALEQSGRQDKRLTLGIAWNGRDRVKLIVKDNGIGISSDNLNRIFQHGFTTKPEGHGFGLHSGANAAKQMGGNLTVHSDGPGTGAAFALEVPASPAAGAMHPLRAP